MELQNYINSHTDYISDFKKLGCKVNTFKKLKIISYPYDKTPDYKDKDDIWKMFLRGVVINQDDKIICLPPVKSFNLEEQGDMIPLNEELEYESLLDGTMINLFYYGDEWLISTRSEIGGYNRWQNKKSFRKMFDECASLDYEILDKNMSYSFVMKHVENRNVTPVKDNEIILVEVYQYSDGTVKRLRKSEYPDNSYLISETTIERSEFMKGYEGPVIPYYIKGFTIKCGSLRYKWINPYFTEVQNLKINMNNHMINYIELRRNGNLKKYLRYYPEHQHIFNNYKDKLHSLTNELHETYRSVFIKKTMEKNSIPYHLNPLIYDIHRQYLETKQPTTWDDIKQYIHTMPTKKLVFALNYC